jgi:hypothetical protein
VLNRFDDRREEREEVHLRRSITFFSLGRRCRRRSRLRGRRSWGGLRCMGGGRRPRGTSGTGCTCQRRPRGGTLPISSDAYTESADIDVVCVTEDGAAALTRWDGRFSGDHYYNHSQTFKLNQALMNSGYMF